MRVFTYFFLTASCTAGIRVEPPTRITSSISEVDNPASLVLDELVPCFLINESANSSNLERVKLISKCNGPLSPAEINGSEI